MQLLSSRTRLLLIMIMWILSTGALLLWLSGARTTYVAIAGGAANSETLALTKAIAEVLNETESGLIVSVFETGGSSETLRLLKAGRIDMGTIQADSAVPDEVVGVSILYEDAYHLIVRSNSDIKRFSDLKGHRIAIPPDSSGQYRSFWFLADHYGLRPDQFSALPMAEAAANFAMEQHQVDAIFRVRAPGNEVIRTLIGDKALRLIPIKQSEALALKQPAISAGVIPMGSYRGYPPLPQEDLDTGLLDRLLVVRADLDSALVYRITRAIFERRSDIIERSKLAGFIAPLPEDSVSVVPAHPGARHYYDRERPGLLQQNARMASAVLYLLAFIGSALLAARTYWVKSKRMRMSGLNRQLMEISVQARYETDRKTLFDIKHQLLDMMGSVVTDLEKERVNQEEFERFTFAWQAVDALVRDRLMLVTSDHSTDVVRG